MQFTSSTNMTSTPDLDLDYLSQGFDPSSLTVPKLRNILVAHNVAFPSSAKKGQLIDIFNESVVPQAKKILSARSRTKRSARGIQDVPSSQEASVSDDDNEQIITETAQRTPRARKPSRKSEAVATEDAIRGSRSTAKRKTQHNFETVEVKPEPLDTPKFQPPSNDSPFSADNPFQSGSSPILPARSPSGARRRKPSGPDEGKERRKRSSSRRKTDHTAGRVSTGGALQTQAQEIRVPLSRVNRADDEIVSAGEEFTPEERQELALEQQTNDLATRPAKRRKKSTPQGSFARIAPLAVSLAMLGGIATVWRQEKINVGFCGVGKPSEMLAGVEIPEWADIARPKCEPCPPHAYCYDKLQASCEPGFVLAPHPLSLGGIVPLPATCEPDGEKARKVQAVADRAIAELRERNAQFECGELKDESGKRLPNAEMEEPALKEKVASKRRKGMTQEEFEELWEPALGEMLNRDEIVSDVNGPPSSSGSGTGQQPRTLRSISHAHIPLACAVRRSVRLALARHLGKLITVAALVGAAFFLRARFASQRAAEDKAKHLARFALDRLAAHAALHAADPARAPEAHVSVAQLRDDVLRDEFSAKRRALLWDKVLRKVEENANVRSAVREGRSGEVGRVWEWIGALDLDMFADGHGAGSRRKSARFSLGAGESQAELSPETSERHVSSWEEARPIY